MTDQNLWTAFVTNSERLADLSDAAIADLPADTRIEWTGREVGPSFFAEHLREEMVLHRWDLTGDGARWHSTAGPEVLGHLRTLLSGY